MPKKFKPRRTDDLFPTHPNQLVSVAASGGSTGVNTAIPYTWSALHTFTAGLVGNLTGNVIGNLTGNASTATALQTGRTINGVTFDGTQNIVINLTHSLTPGAYLTGSAFDGSADRTFAVDATSTNTASKVVARDVNGDFAARIITAALVGNVTGNVTGNLTGNVTGNASTATALQTPRTINGVSFDGTADIEIPAGNGPREDISKTHSSVGSGATVTGTVDITYPSALLLNFTCDTECWIRFYATAADLAADAARVRTTDPTAGMGVLGEFIITAALVDYVFHVAPMFGLQNSDDPIDTVLYYAITNDSGSTEDISFTLTIVSEETV